MEKKTKGKIREDIKVNCRFGGFCYTKESKNRKIHCNKCQKEIIEKGGKFYKET